MQFNNSHYGSCGYPESCDESLRSGAILYDEPVDNGLYNAWRILNYQCSECGENALDVGGEGCVSEFVWYVCPRYEWGVEAHLNCY